MIPQPPGDPPGPSPVAVPALPPAEIASDDLPAEIAFLAHYGVRRTDLLLAAATAAASGVTADCALLTEGLMSAQLFYEILAHYLGVAYLHRPLPVARDVGLEQAMVAQIVRVAANPTGIDYVLAPRGEVLAMLLRRYEANHWSGAKRVAVTSPQRLAALVRLNHRRTIVRDASHGLPDWNPALSARAGWSIGQAVLGFCLGLALAYGAGTAPRATVEAVCLAFSVAFLAMVVVRLAATAWSAGDPREPGPRTPDHRLPIYTVVVPLFRESRVVAELVQALRRLDYPATRLDIKIIVEAGDRDTREALEAECLPDRFEVLMAPEGYPQTKPRALNVALRFARGDYVVIYDAEDEPDPGQLREAVAMFEGSDERLGCLQARLAIDNGGDGWLARLFTLEYASLFDVINPGLARLGLPIALGGTSNHFRIDALRRVNGWDAWNVTEDIDLGIRLARFGYRIGMLQSSTYEEAPARLRAWLGQRRRWQKGWMMTLRTHSRDPGRLFAQMGAIRGLATVAILFGTVSSSLLGPFFAAGLVADVWVGPLLSPNTPSEVAWTGLAATLVVLGALSLLWPIGLGMLRRGRLGLAAWAVLLPAYLVLLSLASWQALIEMMARPYAWTKTEHGLAQHREHPAATTLIPGS